MKDDRGTWKVPADGRSFSVNSLSVSVVLDHHLHCSMGLMYAYLRLVLVAVQYVSKVSSVPFKASAKWEKLHSKSCLGKKSQELVNKEEKEIRPLENRKCKKKSMGIKTAGNWKLNWKSQQHWKTGYLHATRESTPNMRGKFSAKKKNWLEPGGQLKQ